MTTLYQLTNSNFKEYQTDSPKPVDVENAITGAMVGAAIGDAAGVPYEVFGNFMCNLKHKIARKFIPLEKGYVSGTHRKPPGTWSDDTSMGLSLAMSMLTNNGFDQKVCADWYSSWLEKGTLSSMPYTWGIGQMTSEVLTRYLVFEDVEKAHQGLTSRPTNGCVMRNFPVGCYYWDDFQKAIETSQRQTEITNWGDACEVAIMMSCLQTEIIWKCINNHNLPEDKRKTLLQIIEDSMEPHIKAGNKYIIALNNILFKNEVTEDTPPFYVGSSFTAMVFAIHGLTVLDKYEKVHGKDTSYVYGINNVIKLGGDTDTNGCIYGAMAGAYIGYDNLPEHLKKNLVYENFIKTLGRSLFNKKDLVTGNFQVRYDHNQKFKPDSGPKHLFEKATKESLYGSRMTYSMLMELEKLSKPTPSVEEAQMELLANESNNDTDSEVEDGTHNPLDTNEFLEAEQDDDYEYDYDNQ